MHALKSASVKPQKGDSRESKYINLKISVSTLKGKSKIGDEKKNKREIKQNHNRCVCIEYFLLQNYGDI
jgi:hypothetical protein